MEKKPLPPGFQARKIQPVELPDPSSFRKLRPAVLGTPALTVKARWFERKRVIVGLGIAAAFHLSLGLAWWLTPPLRLKAGIDPRRWVQVVSLPAPDAPPRAAAPLVAAPVFIEPPPMRTMPSAPPPDSGSHH
jgi:hypothetical protein